MRVNKHIKMQTVLEEMIGMEVVEDGNRCRKVEVRSLKEVQPRSAILLFEDFPVWLFTLKKEWIICLYFPNYLSLSHLIQVLVSKYGNKAWFMGKLEELGLDNLIFNIKIADYPQHLCLVSGSLYFLKCSTSQGIREGIFVLQDSWRRRSVPLSTGGLSWKRVPAVECGCAMDFQVLLGVKKVQPMIPFTGIRRTIGHFVDHGIRPRVLKDPPSMVAKSERKEYFLEDVFQGKFVEQQIILPTHFSRSGWGIRKITVKEWGDLFGLDLKAAHPKVHFHFPPIQVLSPILRSVISAGRHVVPVLSNGTLTIETPTVRDRTWLPDLDCHLSHEWILSEGNFAKAARADDEEIEKELWNLRCLLVFPQYSVEELEMVRELF